MFYLTNQQKPDVFREITNKMKYGLPELKENYNKYLLRGLMTATISVTLVSIVILQCYISAGFKRETESITSERIININESQAENSVQKSPLILRKIPHKDLTALAPEAVPLKKMKESIKLKSQEELENIKLPVSSTGTNEFSKSDTDINGKFENVKSGKDNNSPNGTSNEKFEQFQVERSPAAKNLSSIRELINYPERAKDKGIEGRVVARILVGKDGSVLEVGGISGPEIFYSEVTDKVVRLKFTPAIHNSRAVKCWVNVPFNFKLEEEN